MQFNAESNSMEGKKKYNFYMNGESDNKKKESKLLLPNKDITDVNGQIIATNNLNIKSDEEYLREIKEVEDYNKSLLTVDPEINKYKFNGNCVIVRLFKHIPYLEKSGIFVPNELVIPFQDKESGRFKTMVNPLQYDHRGVINYISDQCSDVFRNKFKVGDVVDLKFGINIAQHRTWLNPEEYYNEEFHNYFNINENMIEKGLI